MKHALGGESRTVREASGGFEEIRGVTSKPLKSDKAWLVPYWLINGPGTSRGSKDCNYLELYSYESYRENIYIPDIFYGQLYDSEYTNNLSGFLLPRENSSRDPWWARSKTSLSRLRR
jgi:hypothetical protein